MILFRSVWGAVCVVVLIALLLMIPGLGRAPFDDPGEGMHAEIAREILLTGDWITLHLNGVRYFDKPPLLYWLTAAGMMAWRPAESAARLWPVVGALAAIAGTAFLGAKLYSVRVGIVAGLALLTSAGFFAYARYLRPETLFVAAIQWGIALLLLGFIKSRPLTTTAGCACFGFAVLAKDLLGAVGPLAAFVAALALAGRLRPVSAWLTWSGAALLLVVGGAWYLIAGLSNPGFLWYTLVDNHLLNAVQWRHFPDEDIPLSSLEFLIVGGLGAFPWIVPAVLMVVSLLRRRAWREPEETPWMVLAIWAVGLYALFLLLPFKLPHYALPVYPALALLAARWWEEGRAVRAMLAFHFVAFVAIALALIWVYWSDGRLFTDSILGATDVYTKKEMAVGQPSPLPPWEDLRRLVGGTALIFGLGSIGILPALFKTSRMLGLTAIATTLLVWIPLVGYAESKVSASRSVRQMAREISFRAGPRDPLVHEGPIENSGALEFYSGRRPFILEGRVSVLGFGATFPEAREIFWERSRVIEAWQGPDRIFLLTIRSPDKSVVRDLPASSVNALAAGGGRWLYSNRP